MRLFKSRKTEGEESRAGFRWLFLTATIVFVLLSVTTVAVFAYDYKYRNLIYPGVSIGGVSVSGLTKTAAEDKLKNLLGQRFNGGFQFSFENNSRTISRGELLNFNVQRMVDDAYNQGRIRSVISNAFRPITFFIFKKNIEPQYTLERDKLRDAVQSEFKFLEKPFQDTELQIKIENVTSRTYQVAFTDPLVGESFDYAGALQDLSNNISRFNNPSIWLTKSIVYPEVTVAEAEALRPEIDKLLSYDGLEFTFASESWKLDWNDYVYWLDMKKVDGRPTVVLNEEIVRGRLQSLAQEINEPYADAKLQIKDGRVVEFVASQVGREVDIDKTYQNIEENFLKQGHNKIELVVNITEPKIKISSTNDLGIKEVLGTGTSNFAGSPANRRQNIGVGSASLNGVLVAPGEEFSLVTTLGAIDGASGYLPELVIKDNKTTPEFGGGLCQVGTTIFRAALDAGLPILERRNHSYRVVYYEPAGTDATIYNPKPDVRFLNDTGNYILIQTAKAGDLLKFQIWGTADGRKNSFEGQKTVTSMKDLKPTVFNITSPGAKKEIETTDLKPGEKKKLESAHNGADAIFYRTVTYPDGHEMKDTFRSHYVPWREVWLVGVDPAQKEADAKQVNAEAEANSALDVPVPATVSN